MEFLFLGVDIYSRYPKGSWFKFPVSFLVLQGKAREKAAKMEALWSQSFTVGSTWE